MKPTDFAYHLSKYLNTYLTGQQNFSHNTIASYKDTFKLFLRFCHSKKNISPERLTLSLCSRELVLDFLQWLEQIRRCGESTRNQRLVVLRSFFGYLQNETPEHLFLCQTILKIKSSRSATETVHYLSFEGVKTLLEQPDLRTPQGLRDMVLLALLYDTGARVQEIVDLRVRDVRLGNPPGVNLTGKGRKQRHVPMMNSMANTLHDYIETMRLNTPDKMDHPLFTNRSLHKLTRAGIAYVLDKYAKSARLKLPSCIPEKISPHVLRHSKAIHLLESGVNLIYIRDILGHVSVKTTEIYARISSKAKREALEAAYSNPAPYRQPLWTKDEQIMQMLRGLT